MIQINGTIKLGRTIDATMQKSLVEMVRASRAEDGCLDYSFARDLADPDTLVLFERWRDRAALGMHMGNPRTWRNSKRSWRPTRPPRAISGSTRPTRASRSADPRHIRRV